MRDRVFVPILLGCLLVLAGAWAALILALAVAAFILAGILVLCIIFMPLWLPVVVLL